MVKYLFRMLRAAVSVGFGFLLLADVENEFAYLYASKYSAFDFRQDVCKGFQVSRVTRREEEEFFLLFFNGEGVSQQQTTHDILAAISICYYRCGLDSFT